MSTANAVWLESGPYTVFDVETTGLSPVAGRIIEIGAVRIGTDGVMQTYQTLVNPQMPLSPQIVRITGISEEMVSGAPLFDEIAPDLFEFIRGTKLVAHNARFDLSFLMESFARANKTPNWHGGAFDTVTLTRKAYPGLASYSLPALRQNFLLGEGLEGRAHRALFDAQVTAELLFIVMKKLSSGH